MKPLALADVDHPFLKNISPEHLKILDDCAMRCHFAPGEVIFHESDPANRFYLIEKGKVALISANKRDTQQIQVIGAGEVLGWSWLFPPYVWHFDAQAEEDTDAISFPAARLRDDCEIDKTFGY